MSQFEHIHRKDLLDEQQQAHESAAPAEHGNGLARCVKVLRLSALFGRLAHCIGGTSDGSCKRERESRAYDLAKEKKLPRRERQQVIAARRPVPCLEPELSED